MAIVKKRKIKIGNFEVGGGKFSVIAGPCAIESQESFEQLALQLRDHGAVMLRGGIYKLRTAPDFFQGLGSKGLAIAKRIKQRVGLPFISEITDPRQIDELGEVVDMFQVGTRNMYNYPLLRELGRTKKPVMLKRAMSATIEEWLRASEYITSAGNYDIVLCERGIRTFESAMRNTLDLGAVAYLQGKTEFPVIVDPSHATGSARLVEPMAAAAVAAGADGLMIEVHANPSQALSDGLQAIEPEQFGRLMNTVSRVLTALDKSLATPTIKVDPAASKAGGRRLQAVPLPATQE